MLIMLKILKYASELMFVLAAAAIVFMMVSEGIHSQADHACSMAAAGCLIWGTLTALSLYCFHSQKRGIPALIGQAIPPILCGLIIFGIGWPNVITLDHERNRKILVSAAMAVCIAALSPAACYFFNILLIRQKNTIISADKTPLK